MQNNYKTTVIKLNPNRWSECLVKPGIHSSLSHQIKSQYAFTLLQQATRKTKLN